MLEALTLGALRGVSPSLPNNQLTAWHNASRTIRSNYEILGDAEASSSLSLVLLPRQSGQPSSTDCLAARSMIDHLSEGDFDAVAARIGQQDRSTYRGFLDQIAGRIAVDCAS